MEKIWKSIIRKILRWINCMDDANEVLDSSDDDDVNVDRDPDTARVTDNGNEDGYTTTEEPYLRCLNSRHEFHGFERHLVQQHQIVFA